MKYKQTYSDKQREAQKSKKEMGDQAHHKTEENAGKVGPVESPVDRKNPPADKDKDKSKNAA